MGVLLLDLLNYLWAQVIFVLRVFEIEVLAKQLVVMVPS